MEGRRQPEANSNLASNEYFMPILGLIFLRHATNRYYEVLEEISEAKASGSMPDREVREADFTSRGAMMLPEPQSTEEMSVGAGRRCKKVPLCFWDNGL